MDGGRRRRGGEGAGTIARTQVGGRTAFRALRELPARVYQRQPRLWDRVVLAAGWALLYLVVSGAVADAEAGAAGLAFPNEWRLVLTSLVFVLGVWKPVAGYAAFIVAIAYPLYLVSIYVMALALAVLVMLLPVMAAYSEQGVLFLALLVLLAPLLTRGRSANSMACVSPAAGTRHEGLPLSGHHRHRSKPARGQEKVALCLLS